MSIFEFLFCDHNVVFNDDKHNTLYVVDVWKLKQMKNGMCDMMTISKFHMEKFHDNFKFQNIIINYKIVYFSILYDNIMLWNSKILLGLKIKN